MDGAAKGNLSEAGGGGVFRNTRGDWVLGFCCYLGVCSSFRAELLALLYGLRIAWSQGFRKLIVHIDSKTPMKLLEAEACSMSTHVHLILKCRALLANKQWVTKLNHSFRELNRVADCLANIGVTHTVPCELFESPSPSVSKLVMEDIVGLAWPRVICRNE